MKKYLETDRLLLRELTLDDEQNIFELDSDPEVMKYLTNGAPSSREDVRSALLRTLSLYKKHNSRFGFWAAIENRSGEFMGWFHFRPSKRDPDNVKRIELGYRLKKKFWGNGFATEGSRALISNGFRELGIDEVFAVTMKNNRASQRVMEKVGLVFCREFHNEEHPDSQELDVEYSVSKGRWSPLKP